MPSFLKQLLNPDDWNLFYSLRMKALPQSLDNPPIHLLMNNLLTLIFCLTLAGLGCQQANPYDAYAHDFCNCVQPFADLQERIMAMDENTTEEEMGKIFSDGQKVDAEVQSCLLGLQEKYPDLDLAKEGEVMNALRSACPEIVKLMEDSANPEADLPEENPEVVQ